MEMAYRERWEAEIAEMRHVLAGFEMTEECKWGFAAAKQSATRVSRIDKAMPAILEGRGFLERR